MPSIIIVLFFHMITSFTHDFYVSYTELFYKTKENQIQIINHVFIDDIEGFLRTQTNEKIALLPDNNKPLIDSLVKYFFLENFQISIDNKKIELSYLGRQYKDDQLLIFAEVIPFDKLKELEIQNTILTSFISKQQNIVSLKTEASKKNFLMSNSKTTLKASFD